VTTWEYKFECLQQKDIESTLNNLGRDGWEAFGLAVNGMVWGIGLKRELKKPDMSATLPEASSSS